MLRLLVLKLFFATLLITFSAIQSSAQLLVRTRSTVSISGTSKSLSTQQNKLRITQIIGQEGVAGTVHSGNKTLIQGFVIPKVSKALIKQQTETEIHIMQVPYTDTYKVSFSEQMAGDYYIRLYNVNGQLLFTRNIYRQSDFEIDLSGHPVGYYILIIKGNQQQYVEKLPKLK